MSGKRRVFQIGERIKEIVAQHLIHAADPRFSLVTITAVMVSPDLRNAKVYWVVSMPSNVDRNERLHEVDEALENAQGHFRKIISRELGIRFVPVLRFYYDDTLDTAEEVERLMARVRPEDRAPLTQVEESDDGEEGDSVESE
jgi:ribosome-binding factor A